jgi:uncharacterized membrane protein YcaP (DUF421 family)
MKKFEMHLTDWQRILFGQAPPIFLLEVFVRTLILYIFLLFILRWLGKRMSGQVTILEMIVMLVLGAVISVGMQVPDRGITLSMFGLFCTLVFQQGVSWLGTKSAKVEQLTQGTISTLVKDGMLELDEMRRCRITRQQLFSKLRNKGIYSLGDVRRVYLETCGLFSTIKRDQPEAGLPTLPPGDLRIIELLERNGEMACCVCGQTCKMQTSSEKCARCGSGSWTEAAVNNNHN